MWGLVFASLDAQPTQDADSVPQLEHSPLGGGSGLSTPPQQSRRPSRIIILHCVMLSHIDRHTAASSRLTDGHWIRCALHSVVCIAVLAVRNVAAQDLRGSRSSLSHLESPGDGGSPRLPRTPSSPATGMPAGWTEWTATTPCVRTDRIAHWL